MTNPTRYLLSLGHTSTKSVGELLRSVPTTCRKLVAATGDITNSKLGCRHKIVKKRNLKPVSNSSFRLFSCRRPLSDWVQPLLIADHGGHIISEFAIISCRICKKNQSEIGQKQVGSPSVTRALAFHCVKVCLIILLFKYWSIQKNYCAILQILY